MKLKKGDNVMVVTGKDKGKSGVIVAAFPKENLVLIENVNVKKKNQKARRGGQKGQIIEKAMPIHVSNVMIMDPKKNKPTRISIKREDGKRVRVGVKSGAAIGK